MSKLSKYREDIAEENKLHKQQIKQLEDLKLEKLLSDNDYIKNMIGKVEKRVNEEIDKRIQFEFENRNLFEQKMNQFKEEIRSDEK